MWVARDKNGSLRLYVDKPVQKKMLGSEFECWDWCTDMDKMVGYIPSEMFEELKYGDEPIEVDIFPKNTKVVETPIEPIDDTIVLTTYHQNYDDDREWFINMLKSQGGRYKDYSDEQLEEVWQDHLKVEYTFDEFWDIIQCDGYTKIVFHMGRHDNQPDYDMVCESKEWIEEQKRLKGF